MLDGYQVNTDLLREIATGVRRAADSADSARIPATPDAGESTGTLDAALTRIAESVAALREAMTGIADDLNATARSYDEADEVSADLINRAGNPGP